MGVGGAGMLDELAVRRGCCKGLRVVDVLLAWMRLCSWVASGLLAGDGVYTVRSGRLHHLPITASQLYQ